MKPLIVALDVDTDKEALALVKATKKHVDLYKVGPGLVIRYGPEIFKKIKNAGKKIFLDMKHHDIPNTVARIVKEVGQWGIYSSTLHLSSGVRALEQAAQVKIRPQLWGVTVLTSLSEHDLLEMGMNTSPLDQVLRLASLAKKAKIDGVVASVGETVHLRALLGSALKIITPGIRLPEDNIGDQVRTATPQHAREAGADFIVVGRPIIESKAPDNLVEKIMKDWKLGNKK